MACVKTGVKGACFKAISSMVTTTVVAGLKIAALISSGGASAAGIFAAGAAAPITFAEPADILAFTASQVGLLGTEVSAVLDEYNASSGKELADAGWTSIMASLKNLVTASLDGVNKYASFIIRMLLADENPFPDWEQIPGFTEMTFPNKVKAWVKQKGCPSGSPDTCTGWSAVLGEGLMTLALRIIKEIDPTGLVDVIDSFYHPICAAAANAYTI
jgi:hypothetical protein